MKKICSIILLFLTLACTLCINIDAAYISKNPVTSQHNYGSTNLSISDYSGSAITTMAVRYGDWAYVAYSYYVHFYAADTNGSLLADVTGTTSAGASWSGNPAYFVTSGHSASGYLNGVLDTFTSGSGGTHQPGGWLLS